MTPFRNPNRTPLFRLLTVSAAGLGGFTIALIAMNWGVGNGLLQMPSEILGGLIAALCALAAAVSSLSFFAGVDESVGYVYSETQVDKLTGMHARTAMVGKLAEAATRSARTGKPVFLIDIDVDRFKQMNESIGYQAGDLLIHALSVRLRTLLPADVVVGRIGAGEFAVLIDDQTEFQDPERFLDRLMAQLSEPYMLDSRMQSVNLSIGVVAMPQHGTDPVQLLRRSNLALQHARGRGAGTWSFFEDEMGAVAEHRQWIEAELGIAFERGDFDLHYQPQMDLLKGRIVGYEALVRWTHPGRGMIPPAEFIPVAEETGMIGPLGVWILKKACLDAARLPEDCFVAVNISPVQFMTGNFVAQVRATVAETGIDPRRLELEVTETAMMQDRERAASIMRDLADLGISVAVDDFGTGYSNLSYLIDFPFQKLKIDRSFVARMEQDGSGGAVVSTIVGLSRALGVHTIAEGVETEEQAILLKAAGCDVVQGYLYGKPAPLSLHDGAQFAKRHALH